MFEGSADDVLAHAQEALRDGVKLSGVEVVEIAVLVAEHDSLVREFRIGIIADHVVSEVVENLKGEEETRIGHEGCPVEDAFVDDFDFVGMALRGGLCAL